MRLPFIDPPQDKVVAIANDLIVRFGREAHDEALHLAEVAARMRANKNRHLYFLAAREIERSLVDTRTRLNGARASEAAGSRVVDVGALTRPPRHREK
jgi:hypothetical protein